MLKEGQGPKLGAVLRREKRLVNMVNCHIPLDNILSKISIIFLYILLCPQNMTTNVPDQFLKSKFVLDVKVITNIFLKKESI